MATPLSNESRALLRLLADGQWHNYAKVKEALGDQVPPGRALRAYEVRENNRLKHAGTARTTDELCVEDKLVSGRAALANAALNSMRKRHCETREDGVLGERMIRIRPHMRSELLARYVDSSARLPPQTDGDDDGMEDDAECDDPAQPADHSRCEPGHSGCITPAQVRSIVIEAVEDALDRAFGEFQHGLQSYLGRSFADLERVCGQRRRPPYDHQRKGGAHHQNRRRS